MTAFAGAPGLVRLALRRDRIRLSIWVLTLVGLTYASAAAVSGAYDSPERIAAYGRTIGSSPASIAMGGPPVGLGSLVGIMVYETSLTVLLGVAVMAAFTVVRHTRAEEELGRTELLSAAVVGRFAGLSAAVLVALAASVAVGVGVGASVLALGFSGSQALLYGASVAALGVVFAAVGAVAAQLVGHARTASGAALSVLGVAFALRAVGDVNDSLLSWFSPVGWSQQVELATSPRWWPLALSTVTGLVLLIVAAALVTRRDVGSGVLASRPGPAVASRRLSSPLGLAWRLQRGSVLAWTVAIFALGVVFGSVSGDLESLVADNPTLAAYFAATGGSVTDAFLATSLVLVGLGAAGFAVGSVLRLHGEETQGRLDQVLATAVSRVRVAGSGLVVAVVGVVVVVSAGGLGLGLTEAVVGGDPGAVARLVSQSWVQVPAVLVLVGLATTLVGLMPRASVLAWVAMSWSLVVGWLGGVLSLPSWASGLSPFDHLPTVPVEPVSWAPLLVLLLLAVLLAAVGLTGYRRRDLA